MKKKFGKSKMEKHKKCRKQKTQNTARGAPNTEAQNTKYSDLGRSGRPKPDKQEKNKKQGAEGKGPCSFTSSGYKLNHSRSKTKAVAVARLKMLSRSRPNVVICYHYWQNITTSRNYGKFKFVSLEKNITEE